MPKLIDLTGKQFDRWTVIGFDHKDKYGAYYWNCKCECGNDGIVLGGDLRLGRSKSCGCRKKETGRTRSQLNITHGQSKTKTYKTRESMLSRCYNINNARYKSYGGRGIKVCDRWKGDDGFINFLWDMGEKPEGKTLDRIDNNGDYTPDNCRWAYPKEQSNNTRANHIMCIDGISLTVSEALIKYNINRSTLCYRLRKGMSDKEAVTIPIAYKNK